MDQEGDNDQDDPRIPLHRCEPLLAGWIADGRRRIGAQRRAHAPAAANDCSQGRKQVIMDDQKYGARASDDRRQGDREDGDDNAAQHDGGAGPRPQPPLPRILCERRGYFSYFIFYHTVCKYMF